MLLQATGFLVPVCLNGAYFLFKHHSFISIVFFLFEKICKKHHCRDQYPSCHRYNRSCIAGFCCFSRFFCTHRRIFLVSRWLATSCRLSCTIRIIRSRWLAWGNRIWIYRIRIYRFWIYRFYCFSTSVSVAVATSVCLSSFFVSLPSKRSFAAANALSKSDVSL